MIAVDAHFIGGPYDGRHVTLERTPAKVHVEAHGPLHTNPLHARLYPQIHALIECHIYDRLDDPETGEYLGGYVYAGTATVPPRITT